MSEVRRDRAVKLRVGAFVLVALVAFLGMVYLLGARARLFEARYTIVAEFSEVGGLVEGATVRLAGVQVGRVSAVRLPGNPGGKVRVEMSVARRFTDRIRTDSVARIETQGLLGDRLVEIAGGTTGAPAAQPGDRIGARDPVDLTQVVGESAQAVRSVAALAESLRQTAETLNRSGLIEQAVGAVNVARQMAEQVARDLAATTGAARALTERVGRMLDRVERGPGLAHALLYDEPLALRRVDELVARVNELVARVERGEGAVGVLTSERSTEAARRLVAAMDRLGQMAETAPGQEGLLPTMLFDPRYRVVLDDVQVTARNLREVSDRVVAGRGTLGGLVRDEPAGPGLGQATEDLKAAMANLREVTERLNRGEGTLGALLADPAIYERLSAVLDGASRSVLLRALIRRLAPEEEP